MDLTELQYRYTVQEFTEGLMATHQQMATENLLCIREVCQLLHVHANTIRRWADQGLLKQYRIGPAGHRRFRPKDVAALLNEQN